jgi:hypothetical protein
LNHGNPLLFFRRLGAQIRISLGQNFLDGHNAAPKFQNFHQLPAFQLAQRASLLDAYCIADLADILLVMRVEMFRLLIGAFVNAVFLQ